MKAIKPSTSIQFDLLANAADSLEYAIELLAWKDIASDQRRMKQAIMAVAHGVELLLKERLRHRRPKVSWSLRDLLSLFVGRAHVRLHRTRAEAFAPGGTPLLVLMSDSYSLYA